jgi:Major intrinsic protein
MSPVAQRAASEALGTAFLLATVIGSGIMAQRLSGGNDALALLCNTLPTGAILTVLILIFGPVSGAHLNPAVSLAFAIRGDIPWPTVGACLLAGYYCGNHHGQLSFAGSVARGSAIPRGIASAVAGAGGIGLGLFENRAVMIRRQLHDPNELEPGRLYGGNRCFRGDSQFGRRAAWLT